MPSPNPNPNLIAKLESVDKEFDQIEADLLDPNVGGDHQRVRELSVRRAAIEELVTRFRRYKKLQAQIIDNRQIIGSSDKDLADKDLADKDLAEMATAELPELEAESEQLLTAIANDLVTADDRSIGSVMLEVRAGTGGDEAALWAGDLFEMYQRFANLRGWTMTTLEFSPGDQGGIRNAIANVQGSGVWQGLGYESGVHCVKRVPQTETQGRIHTSTATVAVLPEPEKVQLDIPESDVKMDITTAQGPGGQNVNKVATAVHLIHIPTNIEVRMQESKSQQQNRARAWQLLRTRVFDFYQRQKDAQRAEARSKMIGSGERSERIRTYRYKESIVADHRIDGQFALPGILDGELDGLVEALIARDREQRLAAL